jgi:hypothetical protein
MIEMARTRWRRRFWFAMLLALMAVASVRAQQVGVLVVLRDGQTLVSLNRDGRLMGLPDRSPDATRLVTALLQTGTLERPAAIAGLANGQRAVIAGNTPTNDLRPIGPVGTVVREARPTFRWRPRLNVTSYRVTVRDDRGAVIVSSGPIGATSWQSSVALEPGRIYTWNVVPGSHDARFRVIDMEAARLLDERLARAGKSNLLKGLAFTQAGLLDQAEAAFTALAADNQGSDRMRSLLDQIRAMRTAP